MSYTVDVFDGLAQLIANAGIGTYHADGSAYASTETGIVYKAILPSPDRLITITPYVLTDDPSQPLGRLGAQIRVRGTTDPRTCDQSADDIFTLLHGLINTQLGSVHAVQILRTSSVSMGQDDLKRWDRADGYTIDADFPATANRPDGGFW